MSDEVVSDIDEATPVETEKDPGPRRGLRGLPLFVTAVGVAIVLLIVLAQCAPRVPDIVGLSEKQATLKLTAAGYKIGTVSKVALPATPAGKVAEQLPAAGSIVGTGRSVDFVVALGGDLVKVPDVVGSDTPAAEMSLSAKQLVMEATGQYSSVIAPGAVMSQNPPAGALVSVQTPVAVLVSLGLEPEIEGANGVSGGAGVAYSGGDSGSSASGSTKSRCTASYPSATVWADGGDVFIRLSPGGASRRITSGSGWDTNPELAPDAKHVVFMRAPSSGKAPTGVGRVCLTDFSVTMLSLPTPNRTPNATITYGSPVFAPSETGTTPGSDWLVTPQYALVGSDPAEKDARLLVTNVGPGSTWVSTNIFMRSAPQGIRLSESSRPGCVKVTVVGAKGADAVQDFNAHTGRYFR